MIFALIFAFAVILGKNTKLANVACQWNVSKTQTGDGIKSSVAAALIETCTEYEIEFLDAEHSENLIIQKDYETVIKLSGRDTNGGALDQTVYKPVSQGMIVVNNSIDIRRGIVTIENIEFQFIYQTEYQKTLPEYAAINVYNDKDSYGSNPYPKVTLTHCNFKGFGVTARGVHRSLCVNHAISILIDECSFTDMSGTSSLLFSRVDSVIVRNCLFQDISSSNAIQVSNDSRALNIEITDNTFRRISGTDLGNIQIKIFESTTQKSLKINGNIIDSCSHSRSGGIYLEYSEFGTIELKDNQFINNSFTSTTTTNGNGADAFIYKKQQYGSSTSDGAEILQPLFEGSTSTQFESVVYSLIPYGSGSSNIYGNFSLDVICPDGQPAEPLPLGCGCKPDKTVDECACQFGDLRQVCACDAIGDKRVHCVGVTTPCKEASKTQLNQLTTDVCDCLPVGDPRNALCADSKQCSEATKLQLQELNTDICPCIPVGDPRTSVCTSSRACESATSAQLASVSSDICPCLIRQDPRPEECPPAIPCKQVVSDDTTISGTKSSVAAALSETCIDYDISLLDAEHSENLIIQEDYQTVIKLSGRDTNGGALEQTVYKAVPSQSSYVLIGIDIRRGNITIENIDFQFVEQYDKVAPLTAFISVYNSAADYYSFQHPRPNVTITHCNFKGLGANGKVVGRSLNVYEAVHIVIDGCSFTDMKVGTVVQLTEQRSAIVKNSLFQDLQVSNAINVPDNVITSNVEINDSSFIRVSGTDYGTIKIIIQSSGLQFKVRFNRNIVDSCSNTQTGGIYLQLLNYQTIQFSDNTFISNQYTITSNPSTYPPLGADAVIWKRSDDYYLPTGETYFKRAFAGSASDQSNSVGFYLESTRTGGDKFIGQFSIDSFCTGGTPTVPLPEGCKCKPDKTAQQCACQIGDTRNECVCDVIGDQRTHCVGKTKTCNEASSTELAQVSEDICECIPVGDLRSECQQETTPCSKTSKQDLTNLPINICECQPVGDPRSQCSQSKLCNNPSADLTNIPVSRCPCLSTGDGRAGKSEEGFSCPDYCEKGAATEDCTCDTAKDGYTLSECQQEKECKFNLAQQTKEYCPCLPTQDPRSDKCQYCQKRSATEDCICDTDLPGYTLSECQQEKECKYNLASQTKEDCPCLDTGDPREGNGQCPAYCKKGSIEEDCKCDTNAQGYTVADCEEDKIYPRLDYCKETDVQQVEPNTCKCNYEFSPVGCTCPREPDNLNGVPKERCPCPSEFSLLEMDARRYDACLPSWNNQNEVFVGDGQLTIPRVDENWLIKSSLTEQYYGRQKQTSFETLENALQYGVVESKILNIVVVTALSDVQVSVPTDRLINENCSIVSIKRDYIESNEYPVRKAAGRLFSQPGAVNAIFKVEAMSLILSNIDLVSIGPTSGTVIQGESLITGIGKSQIELNNVLLTMGEIIEGIFHSIPTSTAQPSHSLQSFIDIQDSVLTIKNFTAQRGQFVGRGAFSIDQKDGLIKIEDGKFLDCKIVRNSIPSSMKNKMLNEDSSAGAIHVSMERGTGSSAPNLNIDKCSFTSCGRAEAIFGAGLFVGSGSSDNYGKVSITNSEFIYCFGQKTGALLFDNDIIPQNAYNNGFLGNEATLASVNKGNIRSRNTAKLSSSSVETASDIFYQSKDRLNEAGGIMKVANGYHQLDGGSQGEVRIYGYQQILLHILSAKEIVAKFLVKLKQDLHQNVKKKQKKRKRNSGMGYSIDNCFLSANSCCGWINYYYLSVLDQEKQYQEKHKQF